MGEAPCRSGTWCLQLKVTHSVDSSWLQEPLPHCGDSPGLPEEPQLHCRWLHTPSPAHWIPCPLSIPRSHLTAFPSSPHPLLSPSSLCCSSLSALPPSSSVYAHLVAFSTSPPDLFGLSRRSVTLGEERGDQLKVSAPHHRNQTVRS